MMYQLILLSEELLVSLKESASEAFAILSHADSKMLQMRRDDIVPHLAKEFKQLRNDVQKGSEYLFGDNVNERIASITRVIKPQELLLHVALLSKALVQTGQSPTKEDLTMLNQRDQKT